MEDGGGDPSAEDMCTHTTIESRSLKAVFSVAQSSSLWGKGFLVPLTWLFQRVAEVDTEGQEGGK